MSKFTRLFTGAALLAALVLSLLPGEARATGKSAEAYAKPGFYTFMDNGRLWIFRDGSQELADYHAKGKPAVHTVRPGAGPDGITLRAPDGETIDAYLLAKSGFYTFMDNGRLWIFRDGSPELADYKAKGKPAVHTVRPGAGPNGITLRAPDGETIDAYLGAR